LGAWVFCVFYFSTFHNIFFAFTFHLTFTLICFFDSLDGKFARKWDAITEDGKSLDPAADKWVTSCLAVSAYMFGELRWWVLLISSPFFILFFYDPKFFRTRSFLKRSPNYFPKICFYGE
jgi:phosphatidylglycerophosphate synthase